MWYDLVVDTCWVPTEVEELLKLTVDCWGDCSALSKVIALRFWWNLLQCMRKQVPHHDFVKVVSRCVCEINMRKGCHL